MAAPAESAGRDVGIVLWPRAGETLIAEVGGYAVLANINSPNQIVVSGDEAAIHAIMNKAAELEISMAQLNVSNAFHSKYVQAASDTLRARLQCLVVLPSIKSTYIHALRAAHCRRILTSRTILLAK